MNSKRTTIGPKEWVRAGYLTLGVHGLSGVNVEAVAKTLNVSKGSFYWHFQDRQAWLQAILDHCFEKRQDLVKALHQIIDPVARFQTLLEFVDTEASEAGFLGIRSALRLWALTDRSVAIRLNEVDGAFKDIVKKVQTDLGTSENEADRTAQMAFAAFLGYAELKSRDTNWIQPWAEFKDHLQALVLKKTHPPKDPELRITGT